VAAQISDQILVMEKGKQVEYGDTKTIFTQSTQAYTKKLLASVLHSAKIFPSFVKKDADPLVEIQELQTSYALSNDSLFRLKTPRKTILHNLNLDIYQGEILGVVG